MERRLGEPKTEGERAETHEALYGPGELPPRGSGLNPQTVLEKAAVGIELALQRYLRYDAELEFTADAGDNTFNGARVGTSRILVITHMSAYDVNSACTYIRLGYWNRTRYVWVRIVPAPLVLETVEFNGELGLQEGMWPAIQWNTAQANDDIHGLISGYWVRIPRVS